MFGKVNLITGYIPYKVKDDVCRHNLFIFQEFCILWNVGYSDNDREGVRIIEAAAHQIRVNSLELGLRHFITNYRYSQTLANI
jgi:hypothetical protein